MSETVTMAPIAKVGTRAKCRRCGRTVWFRALGRFGYTMAHHAGQMTYQWCARAGTKPRPPTCHDGQPHAVDGFRSFAYEEDVAP